MNKVTSNSASHNKVVLDSLFYNELIHLKFYIHKSSLIPSLIHILILSLIHTLMRILEGHFESL